MLELIMATSLMTAMVVAVGVVLRTGHVTWQAQQADTAKIMAANATVRHIARRVRQAQAVTAISNPNAKEGSLSLLMPSGETLVWTLDKQAEETLFGVDSADNLLSRGITELHFIGYEADGVTQTTVEDDIHSVKCRAVFELPRETNGTRTVSCWAWLRAW
ncbi:MAG: hypothetical protein HQ581_17475 [Planctomycetes bacterium]|nr:hypothetical protein [Planctomycetota bacterium]